MDKALELIQFVINDIEYQMTALEEAGGGEPALWDCYDYGNWESLHSLLKQACGHIESSPE